MLDFKTLETCIWIARLGSFGAAAKKLNTTQPALSIRVAQLEQELGVSLFDRSRRAILPTAQGRSLIDYAQRLLRLRDEMVKEIADPAQIQGVFRLGVAETIVHTWLPAFLEQMALHYPKLSLEIEVDISPNLATRLANQTLDLCFMLGPVNQAFIRSRALCEFQISFVASPRLGLPSGPIGLAALRDWPIITFARATKPYADIVEIFADLPGTPPRIHSSATLATVVRMTLDGIGIAVIPKAIVTKELAAAILQVLDIQVTIPSLTFFACWTAGLDQEKISSIVEMAVLAGAADGRQ